ncbi:MAG: hypothetical protein VYB72_10485 [Planctomycetota bacterium]|nr:hypothetical protein [Planctomycetota bacterium]
MSEVVDSDLGGRLGKASRPSGKVGVIDEYLFHKSISEQESLMY